ncbi:hypothetical protein LPJ62_000650 [Coemansia sp. RSA 2167]|nr:hypothetical protein LPJ62_000650 [Coemansia sp. RSA 2167]
MDTKNTWSRYFADPRHDDRALSDNVRFDEAKMPQSEDAKYIMVYAAVPFKIDDHPIRHTRRVK